MIFNTSQVQLLYQQTKKFNIKNILAVKIIKFWPLF